MLKLTLIFVTILFIIILVIKRFAYFQPKYEFLQPQDTYEDIYQGYLHAWYKEGKRDKVILFCHGNTGNLSFRQDKLIELSKTGYSILIFDYSGYGQSRGVPNEEMFYANVETFYNFLLKRGYTSSKIIPYGENIGAAVAAYIARKYNLPMVIIESGISSMKDMVKYHSPKFLKFFSIFFPEFNTYNFLLNYTGKILVIHSKDDKTIPIEHAQQLINIATLAIITDGPHNNPKIPWNTVYNFIS